MVVQYLLKTYYLQLKTCLRPWPNWIGRLATDQEVAGSSPAGRIYYYENNPKRK